MKKWFPYHNQIPLAEGEVPMNKGGFRTVVEPELELKLTSEYKITYKEFRRAVRTLKKAGVNTEKLYFRLPAPGGFKNYGPMTREQAVTACCRDWEEHIKKEPGD